MLEELRLITLLFASQLSPCPAVSAAALQGADLQSPTMFVTHFIDVSHCNDFSLAKDDGRWPAYNDLFMEIYRLSRCKFAVVSWGHDLRVQHC